MKKHICLVCGYIYDSVTGDPQKGLKPNVDFESLPESWTCPICGVSKKEFEIHDEKVEMNKTIDLNNENRQKKQLAYNEIEKNVFEIGSKHWDREIFDELIPLPDGTSYNAYIVIGSKKTAIIDSVDPEKLEDLFDHLLELDIKKVDYIIANHAEQDHSGAIPMILDEYPEAKIVTNSRCKGFLIDLLELEEEDFKTIENGDKLSLGDKTLEFIFTPWVHWPETMSTYLIEDKILFSCDFFGSHRATSSLFVKNEYKVIEDAKRYYAEIMMPFRNHIKKNIEIIEQKEIKYIAPSHGPVYDRPELIINAYKEWISPNVENKIIIPYVSMHNSTALMVDYLVKSFTAYNIQVIPFNLPKTDIGELSMELVDAATIILASPMVLGGAHPQVVYAAYLTNALRPKARHIAVVGSYGWGGKMIDQLKSLLNNVKAEFLEPVMVRGIPKEADLDLLDELVEKIVELHKNL
jgi:flavorubredoxin/rubredoxin